MRSGHSPRQPEVAPPTSWATSGPLGVFVMPLLIKNPQRWGRTSAFAQGAVCGGGGGQLNPLKAQRPKKTILIIIKKKETILAAFPVLFSQPNALFCPFQTHSFFCRAETEIPGWGGGGEEGTSGRTDGEDCDVPPLCGGTPPQRPPPSARGGLRAPPPPVGGGCRRNVWGGSTQRCRSLRRPCGRSARCPQC